MGYSDPAVVGALELPWRVGVQAAQVGLVVLLANLWGDAMYAKFERSSKSAGSEVRGSVLEGRAVSLADMDVAGAHKVLDGAGSDFHSTVVSSASSECGESVTSAENKSAAPTTSTAPQTVSAKFTLGSHPPTVVGGKCARRARAPVQAPGSRYDGRRKPRRAESQEEGRSSRPFLICPTASCGERGGGLGFCEGPTTCPK